MKIILKKLLDNLVAVTLIYLLMVVVIGFLAKDIASAMGIAIVLTIIGFVGTLIMLKTDMDKNIQNCNVSCTDLMNYICSCMQHNFYPQVIAIPPDVGSICGARISLPGNTGYRTTVCLPLVTPQPLTGNQLTTVRSILQTDCNSALKNGYFIAKSIKVRLPINNGNFVNVDIEVIL
ncbi:hypothetical protein F220043C3_17500 [Enterocloster asparagiformis]|uniref:hypothetical protein n=1 Tax=Enterocloster asparagiformis TaxID=333367 RepID=UPI0034ABD8FC